MPDEIRVEVDPAAVRELFADWNGPVGRAVQQVVDIVEDIARMEAPVSPVGGKFSPPGFLKSATRESDEHHFDDEGHVLGLVGAPGYPYSFISTFRSHKGYTVNPRSARHPGRVTTRPARDDYLARAIEAAPEIVIGRPD
jgi:hypothetical protein